MRTEGGGPGRDAAAVGLGFFIGCTPLYGLHLALVFAVGWLLRLNRLKMYIAANISNPLLAPFLVFAQIQLGAWLRRGSFHALTLQAIRTTDPWTFGLDLLLGSLVLGVVGGIAVAAATYATSRHPGELDDVLMSAADRYLQRGIVAWEFARGKLHGDPIYQEVLSGRLLESGPVLVDIGCGQGLMLAALAEARRRSAAGEWPAGVAGPPVFEHLVGVELRPRIARLARQALDGEVIIHCADAARVEVDPASAILLFDVLHLMPADRQEALLRSLVPRLLPGGTMLVREADAAGGSAFHFVRLGNRVKALTTGNWRQQFAFRSKADWQRLFESLGLESSDRDMSEGTPFANVLFALKPRIISSGQNPRS
jgi:SAM-dependent methyltransferase